MLSEPPDALASKGRKVPVAIGELKIFPLKQENFIRVWRMGCHGGSIVGMADPVAWYVVFCQVEASRLMCAFAGS